MRFPTVVFSVMVSTLVIGLIFKDEPVDTVPMEVLHEYDSSTKGFVCHGGKVHLALGDHVYIPVEVHGSPVWCNDQKL